MDFDKTKVLLMDDEFAVITFNKPDIKHGEITPIIKEMIKFYARNKEAQGVNAKELYDNNFETVEDVQEMADSIVGELRSKNEKNGKNS